MPTGDNREGLWALSVDAASIAKVSILNDNPINFGNALILDTLEWSVTPTLGAPLAASVSASASVAESSVSEFNQSQLADRPFWILGFDTLRNDGPARLVRIAATEREQQAYQQGVDALFTTGPKLFISPFEQPERKLPKAILLPENPDARDRALATVDDGELKSTDLWAE